MSPLYFAVKFAAYSAWCGVGLKTFQPGSGRLVPKALGWGAARLSMGAFFGIAIWVAGSMLAALLRAHPLVIYLVVYVPVRWVEWGLIELFIDPRCRGLKGFALSSGPVARGWRTRGIVLSCLADIPMMASLGGLPLGRFMC